MPRLSDSMEEGTILKWLKPEGAEVERGEELVEIETDKATMSYEADADRRVAHRRRRRRHAADRCADRHDRRGRGPRAEPAARAEQRRRAGARPLRPRAPSAAPAPAPAAPAVATAAAPGTRAKASPLARRLAADRGVDLAALIGTGPGGRIVRADVEAAAAQASPALRTGARARRAASARAGSDARARANARARHRRPPRATSRSSS